MKSKKSKNLIKGKSFFFATFSKWYEGMRMPTNGNLEPFRDYLTSRGVAKLILLDQPVPSSEFVMPIIEVYLGGSKKYKPVKSSFWLYVLYPLLKIFNIHGTRIVYKVRDFFSVLDIGLKRNNKFDYFVGLESINTIAGIILKRLGRVHTVIYYVLDLSPSRYSGGLINKIYMLLDKYCASNADFIWDVSAEFQKIRKEQGLNLDHSAPLIHVPIGLYDYQIVKPVTKKKFSHTLTYVGTLGEENGPGLAIEALSVLLKKYSDATLHIVGGGNKNIDRLEKLSKKINVSKHVKFYGFVPDIRDMVDIISKFDIALAPYREIPGSIRYYADSSKLRTYAGAGLPVVTTPVPPLGKKLAKLGGAIIVKDNKKALSDAVDKIFSNRRVYKKMKVVVEEFSKDNTWNNEFDKAFRKIDELRNN